MLAHPNLREWGSLQYLGVQYVMEAKRISVGKFVNFTRALPVTERASASNRKNFVSMLARMPNVGHDEDFSRVRA